MEVKLRALEPEDLDLLYTIENDIPLWNVGNTNVPYSRFALYNYIATNSNDIYTDKQIRLIIETTQKQIVGMIDLVNFDPKHQRAEIGIVILEAYRKQGYATAAIHQLLKYAHHIVQLHQVYAVINSNHLATISLFERNQFTKKSILKDWLYIDNTYQDAILMQHIF